MKRSERRQLSQAITDLRSWSERVQRIRHTTAHYPISGARTLDPDEESLLRLVEQVSAADLEAAGPLTRSQLFGGRKRSPESRSAADRVVSVHAELTGTGRDQRLEKIEEKHESAVAGERQELATLLEESAQWRSEAAETLSEAEHMAFTRKDVLKKKAAALLTSLVVSVDRHHTAAALLLDPAICTAGTCSDSHASATRLAADVSAWRADRVPKTVRTLRKQTHSLHQSERSRLKTLHRLVSKWPNRVQRIRGVRANAPTVVKQHLAEATFRSVDLNISGHAVRLLPISDADAPLVANLRLLHEHDLSAGEERLLREVTEDAEQFQSIVEPAFGKTWDCPRDHTCESAHAVLADLAQRSAELDAALSRIPDSVRADASDLDDLLEPSLRLMDHVSGDYTAAELLDSDFVARVRDRLGAVLDAEKVAKRTATAAKSAAEEVRAADIARGLQAMELDVLRKASTETIRIGPLQTAGLANVWEVLQHTHANHLSDLPGLGPQTAAAIAQATLRLHEGVREETPVRIDVKRRDRRTTALLETLRSWDAVRRFQPTDDELAAAAALRKLLTMDGPPPRVLALGADRVDSTSFTAVLQEALDRAQPTAQSADVWTDFLSRPADYFGMLSELGFVTEDEAKMHGDLPEEIVQAVRDKELNREHLKASLRAYQSFGARFALVQEKVVIGDEMGLGKTIEALAVFAHLRASGQTHFLVVCPAAVVSNWVRETAKHTTLRAFRIHGNAWDRAHAAKSWARQGGVAVTTFDLLRSDRSLFGGVDVECVVFDEAHYLKNPTSLRSRAAAAVIEEVRHAILMTGTPLENSVQEFRNLIGYLRPDLSDSAPEYLASKFRKHVAPAYLRRNQEDVLTELPELVEVDEWMSMTAADERIYNEAVREGHFMHMRRAAMLSEHSMKVQRLCEIVEEAEDNDRRVIVFSYFRDVLAELAAVLPGQVFGPLTGSMPAVERQRLVDRFSSSGGGSVLVAQITAGGVGLNIQSASVVVICEPQLKPTMESQAIARAHRMGQTSTVQVHRLLTENSVDERIRDILAEKRHLFDEFARDSVIAESAPDAVDVSDAELARLVIAAERERIYGQTGSQTAPAAPA